MRKRLREKITPKDSSAGEQKKRQQLKSSDILAWELECCEKILTDAKRSYKALKARNLQAERKCLTETANFQSLSTIPVDFIPSQGLRQQHIAERNRLTETADCQSLSTIPVDVLPSGGLRQQHIAERNRLTETADFQSLSTIPIDAIPSGGLRQQHIAERNRLTETADFQSLSTIPVDVIPSGGLRQEHVAERSCLTEAANFQSLSTIPVDVIPSGGLGQQHIAFPMLLEAANSPAGSPCDHKDISEHTSEVMVEGQDRSSKQSSKGDHSSKQGLEMKHKQSPELPYSGVPIAEVSQVFVSFLQRLTEHGIVLQSPRTPEFVKNTLIGHTEGTKELGAEKPKVGVSVEQLPLKLGKERRENSSFISRVEVVTERAREIELKDPSALATNQEKIAEERKVESFILELNQEKADHDHSEAELKTTSSLISSRVVKEQSYVEVDEMELQNEFLDLHRNDNVLAESDIEDNDGLKHLWDSMELSLACMKETRNSEGLEASIQNDGCIHEFYNKDDMGLVCSKCGLVGQDAEYIFNYVWGEKSSSMHSRKKPLGENRTMVSEVEDSYELESLSSCKPPIKILTLHPQYKEKLRVHQEEGLRFLERNLLQDEPSGCILAHAPGTGKSFTMIAFLQSFQTAFPDDKPLIVAPKGMLSVWAREFQKWKIDNITILNLQEANSVEGDDDSDNDNFGNQLKRHRQLQMIRQWMAQKSVLMAGYSTFSRLTGDKHAGGLTEIKKLLLEAPGIVILDEGHFPRNKKAQITQSLLQVRTKRRVLLSGTLFQNNFDELYNLYHLVNPDFISSNASCAKSLLANFIKAKSFSANGCLTQSKTPRTRSGRETMELDMFRNLGETIRSGEEGEKKQAISLLRQLSQPFVHWYKGEILADLPGLIDLTLYIRMTKKQQELLSSLPKKTEKQLDFFTKFMRVCIHPVLLKADYDSAQTSEMGLTEDEEDPRSSSKIMFILDLLQLAVPMKEKVVLFSKYLGPFHLLERILKKTWRWNLNREILKIEGRTSLEERENTIDRFNEGSKAKLLLASIKTCGEGVSLIGASRIVLLDVQWNPMVSRQAVSRAFRIGQTKKVFVYRLVGADTKEEDAHLRACEKEWLAKQIFEGCNEGDYGLYCQEVDPIQVDSYFESQHLRENVVKCCRYHFV